MINFTRRALVALAGAAALIAAGPAAAAKPETYTGALSKLAADGYDVVAYFEEGAPVKGAAQFSTEYKGAQWRFATAARLSAFEAAPERYAPQYGGYCAWAVSQGYTAPGNPKNWAVVDGRLYLNYNDKVQRDWNVDRAGFIVKANANWPAVLSR
jgi:YHS domain-containing protein